MLVAVVFSSRCHKPRPAPQMNLEAIMPTHFPERPGTFPLLDNFCCLHGLPNLLTNPIGKNIQNPNPSC